MRRLALLVLAWSLPAHAFLYFPFDHDVGRSRGFSAGHTAIDFVSPCGTPVFAAAAGRVSQAVDHNGCRRCYDCYRGCGDAYVDGPCANNQIYIDHGNGYQTRYLHLEQGSARVDVGDEVQAGQPIGRSSNVGWTCGNTGCHLHFEVKDAQGRSVDPDGGLWLEPRRYGGDIGPPPDGESPSCGFPETPPIQRVLTDGGARLHWRVEDGGGLLGASQSWDGPIPADDEPEFDFRGRDSADGHLDVGWAGLGRHTAHIRAWDAAGHTCEASSGPYWFFPVPFVRRFAISDALLTDGGPRDRLEEAPLGDEGTLRPLPDDPGWRAHESDGPYIDLDALLGGDDRVAYAMTYCDNPGPDRELDVHLGTDDGFRLWINGERVAEAAQPRAPTPDEDTLRVRLRAGENAVLLKVEEKGGGWGFYLRFSQPDAPEEPADVACRSVLRPDPTPPDAGAAPPPDAAETDAFLTPEVSVPDAALGADGHRSAEPDATRHPVADAGLPLPTAGTDARLEGGCRQAPAGTIATLLPLTVLALRRRDGSSSPRRIRRASTHAG